LWLLSLFTFANLNAQVCPETLGNSSTTTLIHFKIAASTCSDYPLTISVEGSTYDRISCNGTNLKYELSSGAPLTIFDTFSADFGSGWTCDYLDGVLRDDTLSIENISVGFKDLKVFPNPLTNSKSMNLMFNKNVSAQINIYDLTGKLVISDEIANESVKQINISSLYSGIYMLQVVADNTSTSRKIVVMK